MDHTETEEKTPKKFIYDNGELNSNFRPLRSLNTYENHYSVSPKYSTPPSRFLKIRNPFEAHLFERLHLPVFSPSVFNKTTPPRSAEKFKWSIDDISAIKPADIDETTMHQVESPIVDPEIESSAQERIDRYFSEKHIVPSPMMLGSSANLIPTTPPRREKRLLKAFYHNESQTDLSLPPELPAEVESVLKPYFSYKGEEIDKVLYKNLFEHNEPSFDTSSVESSPPQPCNLSPVQFSPCQTTSRDFGSPKGDEHGLSECNLSPINEEETWRECRPAARLDFSGDHMSIDTSIGIVPNCYDVLPSNNSTMLLASELESPVRELPSTSETIWDMEFNTVNIKMVDSPTEVSSGRGSAYEEGADTASGGDNPTSGNACPMDTSNTNTPKKKKNLVGFGVQRPKVLSNSFQRMYDHLTGGGELGGDKENEDPDRDLDCRRLDDRDDDDGRAVEEEIEQRRKSFKSDRFCLRTSDLDDEDEGLTHLNYDDDDDDSAPDRAPRASFAPSTSSWLSREFQLRTGDAALERPSSASRNRHLIASTPTKNQF